MPRRVLSHSFLQKSLQKRSQLRFRKFCLHDKDHYSSYTWKAILIYFHYVIQYITGTAFSLLAISFFLYNVGCWALSLNELCEDNVVTSLNKNSQIQWSILGLLAFFAYSAAIHYEFVLLLYIVHVELFLLVVMIDFGHLWTT